MLRLLQYIDLFNFTVSIIVLFIIYNQVKRRGLQLFGPVM